MDKLKVRLDFQAAAAMLAFLSCSFRCDTMHRSASDLALTTGKL